MLTCISDLELTSGDVMGIVTFNSLSVIYLVTDGHRYGAAITSTEDARPSTPTKSLVRLKLHVGWTVMFP